MKTSTRRLPLKHLIMAFLCMMFAEALLAQESPDLHFNFEGDLKSEAYQFIGNGYTFAEGLEGQALTFNGGDYKSLTLARIDLSGAQDFTIQFWVKTRAAEPMPLLSQKHFEDKGIITQKNAGWAFYSSGGTFGWTIGSGERRINYERDNGDKMPINDGQWHQITMAYHKSSSEVWLYYDGLNKAIYKVGFDFANNEPIRIGATDNGFDYEARFLKEITDGAAFLQNYLDAFNELGGGTVANNELLDLIANPQGLLKEKLEKQGKTYNADLLAPALKLRQKLDPSPYTVYQNKKLTALKPVNYLYRLENGSIQINKEAAAKYTLSEKLYPSGFSMDNLSVWNSPLSADEVLESYQKHQPNATAFKLSKRKKQLTVGVWNIWHGGIHWSEEKDGWDSRKRIVEMIREKDVDVILMQETYSGGDFMAAELGYYFATTSDWDYRYQGSNISVISKYPIKDIQVSKETEFNNVAVKLALSKTQEIWAMSNWYGMNNFPKVYDFHKSRFASSDQVPVLFGGDFNAVPHTDGGDSPASRKLLEDGFTDAYRSRYPDVAKYPSPTHQSGSRIDQLYYKGKGLVNTSTEVISTWPSGFPSDHFLIVAKFKLKY